MSNDDRFPKPRLPPYPAAPTRTDPTPSAAAPGFEPELAKLFEYLADRYRIDAS